MDVFNGYIKGKYNLTGRKRKAKENQAGSKAKDD